MDQQSHPQTPQIPARPPEPPRYRFRWGWLIVPATVLFLGWLARGVIPGFQWNGLVDVLHVGDAERYMQLALLGLVAISIVAVVKVWRS